MADAPARRLEALPVAVVGVSQGHTCGVHDHAVLLADALGHENVSCSTHWLWRRADSMSGARSEIGAWTRALAAELDLSRPAAVVLHYSVFDHCYRGVPLFVGMTLSALRGSGVPVVSFLHEFAYPWGRGGPRGAAWALAQRAALVRVMRRSAAVVVTAPFRADWLASRPWLPRRRVAFAPVFSNLPEPALGESRPDRRDHVIGLFGYAYEGVAVTLVLDAVRLLHDRGLRVHLALLGAPGPDSRAADVWLSGARVRAIEPKLSFSGVLAAQDLSNTLAACDVLLHMEPLGPTSRKGTLAGSLASGSAVVAIDGPRRWSELIESQAALVVPPTAIALADAIAGLLDDAGRRAALGARGAAFARRAMGVERSAQVVAGLLKDLVGGGPDRERRDVRDQRPARSC